MSSAIAPLQVVWLGQGPLGLALLEGLLASQWQGLCQITAVFPWSVASQGKTAGSSGAKASGQPHGILDEADRQILKQIARYKLPLVQFAGANTQAFQTFLLQRQPDVVFIGSWGEIFKGPWLQDTPLLNCHPSLLPAYRGANPYASTILHGETATGVTFHWIDAGIDTGPILSQQVVPIHPEDTGGSLRSRCAEAAQAMLPDILQRLQQAKLLGQAFRMHGTQQPRATLPYYPALQLADGFLNWQQPAETLYNRIRALQPWLDSYGWFQVPSGHALLVRIKASQVVSTASGSLFAQKALNRGWPPGPGHIVGTIGGRPCVSTGDPQRILQLRQILLPGVPGLGDGFLPPRLSNMLGRWVLRRHGRFLLPAEVSLA